MLPKPQPHHSPEELARVTHVPPGAQSEYGKRETLGKVQQSRILMTRRRYPNLEPDLQTKRKGRKRWS